MKDFSHELKQITLLGEIRAELFATKFRFGFFVFLVLFSVLGQLAGRPLFEFYLQICGIGILFIYNMFMYFYLKKNKKYLEVFKYLNSFMEITLLTFVIGLGSYVEKNPVLIFSAPMVLVYFVLLALSSLKSNYRIVLFTLGVILAEYTTLVAIAFSDMQTFNQILIENTNIFRPQFIAEGMVFSILNGVPIGIFLSMLYAGVTGWLIAFGIRNTATTTEAQKDLISNAEKRQIVEQTIPEKLTATDGVQKILENLFDDAYAQVQEEYFSKEHSFIQKIKNNIEKNLNLSLLKQEYSDLGIRYIQLLKQSAKLMKISDSNQKRLVKSKERLGLELDIARKIQATVLPTFTQLQSDLEIAGRVDTSNEVGGDYYDVIEKDGKTYMAIGDVTDHGLASGLIMLMTQSAFFTTIQQTSDLKAALIAINSVLHSNIRKRLKDIRNLTLSLFSYEAGVVKTVGQHENIIHYKAATDEVDIIDTFNFGMTVGLVEDIETFINEKEIVMEHGDCLLLYTDGAVEIEKNKEYYTIQRLIASFLKHRTLPVEVVIENMFDDIYSFAGTKETPDDITLMVVKRK